MIGSVYSLNLVIKLKLRTHGLWWKYVTPQKQLTISGYVTKWHLSHVSFIHLFKLSGLHNPRKHQQALTSHLLNVRLSKTPRLRMNIKAFWDQLMWVCQSWFPVVQVIDGISCSFIKPVSRRVGSSLSVTALTGRRWRREIWILIGGKIRWVLVSEWDDERRRRRQKSPLTQILHTYNFFNVSLTLIIF